MPNVGLDALPMDLQPSFALVEPLNPPPVEDVSIPKRRKQVSKPEKKAAKELGVSSPLVSKAICTGVQIHSFRTPLLFLPGSTPVTGHVLPSFLVDPLHVCSVLCPLSFSQVELCRCYFSSPICSKCPLYQIRLFHGLCQGNFSPQDLLVLKMFPFFLQGYKILDSDPHLMTLAGLPICQMFFSVQDFL